MKQLARTTSDSEVMIASAASALAFPPTSFARVPGWSSADDSQGEVWSRNSGVVPEMDLEIWSTGTLNLTVAELLACKLRPIVLADLDVTTFTHGTDTANLVAHGLETGDGPIRFHASGTIVCAANAAAADGDIVTVGDGLTTVTFEYDKTGNGVVAGRTAWAVGTTAASNATALRLLILAAFPTFTVTDSLAGTLTVKNPNGNVTIVRVGGVTTSVTEGTLPVGLEPATDYWAIASTANTFKLAATFEDAFAAVPVVVPFTSNGVGVVAFSDTDDTKRIVWYSLGPLVTPIALTKNRGHLQRIDHRSGVVAYGMVGTLSAGVVYASVTPVTDAD
jgi:hypothetical protein